MAWSAKQRHASMEEFAAELGAYLRTPPTPAESPHPQESSDPVIRSVPPAAETVSKDGDKNAQTTSDAATPARILLPRLKPRPVFRRNVITLLLAAAVLTGTLVVLARRSWRAPGTPTQGTGRASDLADVREDQPTADSSIVSSLVEALDDESREIRSNASESLRSYADREAVTAVLVRHLSEDGLQTELGREAAIGVLRELDPVAAAEIVKGLATGPTGPP
jgi:hypothetical protein